MEIIAWIIIIAAIVGGSIARIKSIYKGASSGHERAVEEQRRRKAEYDAQQMNRKYQPDRQNSVGEYYSKDDVSPYRRDDLVGETKTQHTAPETDTEAERHGSFPGSWVGIPGYNPRPEPVYKGNPYQQQPPAPKPTRAVVKPKKGQAQPILSAEVQQITQTAPAMAAVTPLSSTVGAANNFELELMPEGKGFEREDLVRGIVMAEILGPCKARAGHR